MSDWQYGERTADAGLEILAGLQILSLSIHHIGCDGKQVTGLLIEHVIWFGIRTVAGRIVEDLLDACRRRHSVGVGEADASPACSTISTEPEKQTVIRGLTLSIQLIEVNIAFWHPLSADTAVQLAGIGKFTWSPVF